MSQQPAPSRRSDRSPSMKPLGLSFSETMSGEFHLLAPLPDGTGAGAGGSMGFMAMHATVEIPDLAAFTGSQRHRAPLKGQVSFPPFGPEPVAGAGTVELFKEAPDSAARLMVYQLALSVGGRPYFLSGTKTVRKGDLPRIWKATTILETLLYEGHSSKGRVVGSGTLTLELAEFLSMLGSMRASERHSPIAYLRSVTGFGWFFTTQLWRACFPPAEPPRPVAAPGTVEPEHFDVVIVGSGFGGSVMAHELAGAGMKVCLLERGKSYPPGSFPRTPRDMGMNFWDPSKGLYGLFDVWSFTASEALVSSGLGGGSLIYANVLIRKPAEWFQEEAPDGTLKPWPVGRLDLDPHYDAVEKMLGGNPYPLADEPYATTPKTLEFRDAAERAGYRWTLPNLAVSFARADGAPPAPDEPILEMDGNLHQRPRRTCSLCGECDIGCNSGSKNTLDFNYLSAAKRAGAVIRVSCEVKEIKPAAGGGYQVSYVTHDPVGRAGQAIASSELPRTTLHASRLVLSAGALGSTFLLLKNRKNFPEISPALGSNYSTNGDLLTFAFDCKLPGGRKEASRLIEPSRGPVITSTITVENGSQGMLLQDAGYPVFLSWMVDASAIPLWIRRVWRFVCRRIDQILTGDPQTEVSEQVADLLGNGRLSSSSIPLLGMGRDQPDGRMTVHVSRRGKEFLHVDWSGRSSKSYFKALNGVSREIAEKLGGDFQENPDTRHLKRLVTVHPLGGCPMGRDEDEGVVDSWGRVFNYPGLYVADGSVMPGPVGSNPSLTIAALSRRFAHKIIEESVAKGQGSVASG